MKSRFLIELDFGMGNIRSLQKAFEYLGEKVFVSSDKSHINEADALLIPGDGAFKVAMEELGSRELIDPILQFIQSGRPVLGICIGFQILFSSSTEFGEHSGLNLFSGKIDRFPKNHLTVPHIGWSQINILKQDPWLYGLEKTPWFYFIHSYRLAGRIEYTLATCKYGDEFTAIVRKGNLFGTQFHPEKSSDGGLQLLKNFLGQLDENYSST